MGPPTMASAVPWARIDRRLKKIEADLAAFRSAIGTLGSATISKGGIRVKQGADIIAEDGGVIASTFINRASQLRSGAVEAIALFADGSPAWQYALTLDSGDTTLTTTGAIRLASDTDQVFIDHTTGSGSANTIIDATTGLITRVISSNRYKTNVEDAVIDPADVLQLRPVTWTDMSELERDPDTQRRYTGYIAEEVDALPSLRQFVNYDAEGRPDSLNYDRMDTALVVLAKEQQTQIAEQATQITALTERLNLIDGGPPA